MRRLGLLFLLLAGPATAADLLHEATEESAAIEDRVRLVLAHRLTADADALAADVGELEQRDARRQARGLPRTGLTDDVRYLAAGLAPTRDAQRAALKQVLAGHPDPVVRRLAEHGLEADDAAAADRILADDRHNRRAGLLNDAVRPLGIFSGLAFLAAINPFLIAGSVVDSVGTTAVNLWHYNRLSSGEREALVRFQTLLEREPATADAPEIARAIRRLGPKRLRAFCEETVDVGKRALDAGDLDHAAFYLASAGRLDGCAERARQPLEKADRALAERAAREEEGRWPVNDPPRPEPGAETHDWEALLTATAAGEPGAMAEAANRFGQRHDDSDLAPAARYAVAVARHLAGHRDAARDALADVARDTGSAAGRHAAAVLASDDFNRLGAIDDAERRHARETARYIVLGGAMDGRNAVYTAAQFAASGAQAAESFGIFNVIGMLTRAWTAWRHDPVSNAAIIERCEDFLAREPASPDAPAVHARLADVYARAGEYGRAIMHYRATPDPDPKRIARLEAKLADRLLEDADRGDGNRALLEAIVQHFGETKAADKARKKLADRPGDGETVVSRDVLEAHPALLGPDGLDLDPRLLDGDRQNGELADGGVTLAEGELRLKLYNEPGPGQHVDTRPLPPEAYARARAAVQDVLYAQLLTADHQDRDAGRYERYIPFYVQGSVGDGGVYVYPGAKLRKYKSDGSALYE